MDLTNSATISFYTFPDFTWSMFYECVFEDALIKTFTAFCEREQSTCANISNLIPLSQSKVHVATLNNYQTDESNRLDIQFSIGERLTANYIPKKLLLDLLWGTLPELESITGLRIAFVEPPLSNSTLVNIMCHWMLVISVAFVVMVYICARVVLQRIEQAKMRTSLRMRPSIPKGTPQRSSLELSDNGSVKIGAGIGYSNPRGSGGAQQAESSTRHAHSTRYFMSATETEEQIRKQYLRRQRLLLAQQEAAGGKRKKHAFFLMQFANKK